MRATPARRLVSLEPKVPPPLYFIRGNLETAAQEAKIIELFDQIVDQITATKARYEILREKKLYIFRFEFDPETDLKPIEKTIQAILEQNNI